MPKILESSETILLCQKATSTKVLKLIEWLEKVTWRSGRSCCIVNQKVEEKETTRANAGASQILFVKIDTG